MTGQRLAVVVLLLLVGVWGAAAPGAGYPATTMEAGAPADQGMSAANETSMGSQISSFMQSSAAEAEGNVESSMWQVRFENAPDERRGKLVNKRVESLEKRLQRLEERRAELLAGDDVTVAERARAARLASQAESLKEAINDTAEAAEEIGVETKKLDELRTRARNVTGEEVSEMAPGVGEDGTPPAGPRSDGAGAESESSKGDSTSGNTDGAISDVTTPTAADGNSVRVTTGGRLVTTGSQRDADGESANTNGNTNANTGASVNANGNASGGVNETNITNASGVTGTDATDVFTV